jgi:hypothetical protein
VIAGVAGKQRIVKVDRSFASKTYERRGKNLEVNDTEKIVELKSSGERFEVGVGRYASDLSMAGPFDEQWIGCNNADHVVTLAFKDPGALQRKSILPDNNAC